MKAGLKLCGGWEEERWRLEEGEMEARWRLDGGLVYRLVYNTRS